MGEGFIPKAPPGERNRGGGSRLKLAVIPDSTTAHCPSHSKAEGSLGDGACQASGETLAVFVPELAWRELPLLDVLSALFVLGCVVDTLVPACRSLSPTRHRGRCCEQLLCTKPQTLRPKPPTLTPNPQPHKCVILTANLQPSSPNRKSQNPTSKTQPSEKPGTLEPETRNPAPGL